MTDKAFTDEDVELLVCTGHAGVPDYYRPMFHNWLASVKAEAWDEGAAALDLSYTSEWPENPHRTAPNA